LGGVVLRGGDGEMEDDHAGEPTTRGTVVKVERFERFRAKFSFPLDDFQVEAIRAIDADQSVIVSAPTGSGKTLVAEYAIQCALETGMRIAYTTPLKALSNQKFNDFTRAYGADTVGKGRARVVGDESRGADDRGRWYTRRVVDPTVLIEALDARGWLPAIYFIFSRVGCERAMQDVLADGRPLITREQRRDVDTIIGETLAENPSIGESALSHAVFQGLRIGVATHHAGILPGLKRLLETLFERGLCRGGC